MAARDRLRLRLIQTEAEGYLELGMPQHALNVLNRIGDVDHFSSQALYLQGEALKQLGRYSDAIVALRRAADIAPSNIHIWLALGWCHKRLSQIDRAVEALEQAVAVAPDEAITHYNLACYLSLAGAKTRAVVQLTEALLLDPEYREMVDNEQDFDPIRSDSQFRAITSMIA
jgi:Flp pilus assembly protein TadD